MPVRGDKRYEPFYKYIIEHITSLGHTALSEQNFDFKPAVPLTDSEIFIRDIKWLNNSSALVAEVTGASSGVGFEIAYALYKRKIPVLALSNNEAKEISAMINGCNSDLITIRKYKDSNDLKNIISEFLKGSSGS